MSARRLEHSGAAYGKMPAIPYPQRFPAWRHDASETLLSSTDKLRNGVSDDRSSLLRLLLGQSACNAHLERRGRLPSSIFGVESNANREGLEPCNQDSVGETLYVVSREMLYIRRNTKTYLINNISENLVLILNAQFLGLNNLVFENKQHDWVFRRAAAPNPITSGIQLCPHRLDVFSESGQNVWLFL